MFGNYQFSLTSNEQSDWQLWLRFMPVHMQHHPVWKMLHDLSYTDDWTDKPTQPTLSQMEALENEELEAEAVASGSFDKSNESVTLVGDSHLPSNTLTQAMIDAALTKSQAAETPTFEGSSITFNPCEVVELNELLSVCAGVFLHQLELIDVASQQLEAFRTKHNF